MSVELHNGDCLDVMAQLPDASVDAIITDPPYCSGARTSAAISGRGGMSRKAKWNVQPLDTDRMTTTGFVWMMREIAMEAERVLVDGGSMLCFIDWRQYPQLYGAIESANLRIQNMIVWDKMTLALGNGFRNQHELIIHAAKGVPNVYDRATPNVLQVQRINSSDIHPTEKPVELMRKLLAVVSGIGSTVLDPFMGSGSVGVACMLDGRNFVGVEKDPQYYAVARSRIETAQVGEPLFTGAQATVPLFAQAGAQQ